MVMKNFKKKLGGTGRRRKVPDIVCSPPVALVMRARGNESFNRIKMLSKIADDVKHR
jgi:hypothetical protein